jgi:hypothetical protein
VFRFAVVNSTLHRILSLSRIASKVKDTYKQLSSHLKTFKIIVERFIMRVFCFKVFGDSESNMVVLVSSKP